MPEDLTAVATIYNHAVETTTATFDLKPRDSKYFEDWLTSHSGPTFGAFVEVVEDGTVVAYGSLSTLTPRAGYRVSAEPSVYVHPSHQGRGVGRRMMGHLIDHARKKGLYSMIGIITSTNIASLNMLLAHGYEKKGEMNAVGEKFGEILDLHFYQVFFEENVRSEGILS